jgi:hypothetical protein
MALISWSAGNTGNWTTASNWSPAQVPGSSDDALINAPGAYLVTVGTATVNSITLNDAPAEISVVGPLTINSGLVITAGTLAIGSSGVVTANGLSNSGTIADNGSLTVSGSYTPANLGRITDSGLLSLTGTLLNSGGTFDGTALQSLTVTTLGTIQGGTVVGISNVFGATLDAVTWQGNLVPTLMTVRNGLVVTGANGSGPGTISLTGPVLGTGTIDIQGDQTFDNASILQLVNAPNHTSIVADNILTLGSQVSITGNPSNLSGFANTITLAGSGNVISNATIDIVGQFRSKLSTDTQGFIAVADFENGGTVETTGGLGIGSDLFITAPIFDNLPGGTLQTLGGNINIAAATNFTNNGMIVANFGSIFIGGVLAGSGTVTLQNAATIELGSAVGTGESIGFQGPSQLTLDQPVFFAGTINGFTAANVIDLGVAASGISYSANDLKMQLGGGQTFDVAITGSHNFSDFIINTGSSSTTIQLACFAAGTRIGTARGEVAVEQLSVGDHVQVVLGGVPQPVVWIGHRRIDCARHPTPSRVWPVRISACAFGLGQPNRDLFLSPDHAVYFDGVLIPVRYRINRTTIIQVPVDEVTYYHVELPRHDVLLADGLPVETYLDTGDRSNFANGGASIALHPDFASRIWEAEGCAPLVITGPQLDAARDWLNASVAAMRRCGAIVRPGNAQFADCGTNSSCRTEASNSPPRSASVSMRHAPLASTSAGRKRDLYAILRLSGTQ